MKYTFIQIFILLVVSFYAANAQNTNVKNNIPEVGNPMPDFTLSHITHFTSPTASLNDFKGKWLFLDFWFTGCVTCIQSFPKVNTFYVQFKNDINWVMVGLTGKKNGPDTQVFYEKLRERRNLQLPSAYDSVLAHAWGIHSMPHIIVVDPKGVVRHITSGRDMTAEKISDLIKDKPVTFYPKEQVAKDGQNISKKLEVLDSAKVLYRSVLAPWKGEAQQTGYDIDSFMKYKKYLKQDYHFAKMPLKFLYNYAYWGRARISALDSTYGNVYPEPIVELKNKQHFEYSYSSGNKNGFFSYRLFLPNPTKEKIMTSMQQDLERTFGYLTNVEMRSMPVWKLVAKPGAVEKLKTKGGEKFKSPGTHAMGYTYINYPAPFLAASIAFYIKDRFKEPFVDETGLTGHFDFTIDADMTSIDSIRQALQKQGLDLVTGVRNMQVIVIRDGTETLN